jgi:hypothetical protein
MCTRQKIHSYDLSKTMVQSLDNYLSLLAEIQLTRTPVANYTRAYSKPRYSTACLVLASFLGLRKKRQDGRNKKRRGIISSKLPTRLSSPTTTEYLLCLWVVPLMHEPRLMFTIMRIQFYHSKNSSGLKSDSKNFRKLPPNVYVLPYKIHTPSKRTMRRRCRGLWSRIWTRSRMGNSG